MTRRLLALTMALGLFGCWEPPEVPDVITGMATLPITDVRTVPLDAVMPSDVVPLEGDRVFVLDGYAARGWLVDITGDTAPVEVPGDTTWGRPVRASARAEGGFWLADPGAAERGSLLLAVDEAGASLAAIEPHFAEPVDALPLAPTAVIEVGDALVVGDRFGRVAWLDPATGEIARMVEADGGGDRFGTTSDLLVTADGAIVVVDTAAQRIHVIDGDAVTSFGRFGEWAGTLRKAKSVAPTPGGGLLVADSALGVVQMFEGDGRFVATLMEDAEPARWEHPIAIRTLGDDRYVVLDAAEGSLTTFRIGDDALAQARDNGQRYLRTSLLDDDGVDGHALCRNCHDGFVNDNREVWDPRAVHHPVDIVPERELPPFFPLSEDGEIICATCHSPHGVVDEDAALEVAEADGTVELIRHSSEGIGFTRLSVENSALCTACHEDAAHESALSRLDLGGGSHLVGDELEDAMARRPGAGGEATLADGLEKGCLGCHASHGGASEPMLRAADDGVLCVTCHEPQASETHSHPLGAHSGKDMPTPRRTAALLTARNGGVLCRTCHDAVGGRGDALLRRPKDGGQLCLVCHDERKGVTRSPHGKVRGPAGIPCLGCHDVHGLPAEQQFLRMTAKITEADPLGCLSCHGPRGSAFVRGVRPGEAGHAVTDQAGGLAQSDPPLEGCPTCHDSHLATMGGSESCGECHPDQDAEAARGGHGKAECLDCHPAHASAPYTKVVSADVSLQSRQCLACHSERSSQPAETPRVEDYEHPEPVFLPGGGRWKPLGEMPLFGADGDQVPAGRNGELACGSCHRTHGPDPEHEISALRRPGWERPCAACHGDDALSLYLYFHAPDRRSSTEDQP